MTITLRDYQETGENEIRAAYVQGFKAPALVMPTGSGKTVTFASIAHQAGLKGKHVLILVHRRELLKQTSRTLSVFGVDHGLISAGMSFFKKQVQVASVQTLARRLDKLRWTPDLIIVDECHHAVGRNTWGKVLAHYPRARILGVTATPERLDGKGLGVHAAVGQLGEHHRDHDRQHQHEDPRGVRGMGARGGVRRRAGMDGPGRETVRSVLIRHGSRSGVRCPDRGVSPRRVRRKRPIEPSSPGRNRVRNVLVSKNGCSGSNAFS